MHRDIKGQDVLEVALVSALVFFAALFAVMAFGKNISKVFAESASGQATTVAQFDLSDPGVGLPGPNTGGVTITVPTADGGTGEITFPNPDYYTGSSTTTSGAAGYTSETGNYTEDLADVIEEIAALTGNNPNINNLAQIIADTGTAEVAINENLDSENNPDLINLDPSNSSLIDDINAVIANVDDSITQLNDEASTVPDFTSTYTGLDQYSYASELSSALTEVMNDPSIPQETKDILALITGQAEDLADNVTYEVNTTLYDSVVSTINAKVDPTISVAATDTAVKIPTGVDGNITATEINTNLSLASTASDKAIAFMDTIKVINSDPVIAQDFLSSLTAQEKTDLITLTQSLNIDIIMPLDTVINTNLAAQAACIASGGSWDNSGSCS